MLKFHGLVCNGWNSILRWDRDVEVMLRVELPMSILKDSKFLRMIYEICSDLCGAVTN